MSIFIANCQDYMACGQIVNNLWIKSLDKFGFYILASPFDGVTFHDEGRGVSGRFPCAWRERAHLSIYGDWKYLWKQYKNNMEFTRTNASSAARSILNKTCFSNLMIPERKIATSASDQNREKLQKWSESSDYRSISFWIPPSMQPGTDECIAEVAEALTRFESELKSGSIEPANFDPQ